MILRHSSIGEYGIIQQTAVIAESQSTTFIIRVGHRLPAFACRIRTAIVGITNVNQIVLRTVTSLRIHASGRRHIVRITLISQTVVVQIIPCVQEIVSVAGEVHTHLELIAYRRLPFLAALRFYQDNTAVGTCTVDSRRSRILQDLDRLDVGRVDV